MWLAPHARLTLSFMDTRFPKVIEFLTRSFKPSEHFKGMTLSLSSHPFNKISDGYSRNPYMLSKEYALGIIKFLIDNALLMVKGQVLSEKSSKGNASNFFSVTKKGRKMLCEGISRVTEFNCSKKRENYIFSFQTLCWEGVE